MENNIRTFIVAEPWAPLDQRWAAQIRLAGRTIGSYGATRDDAIASLRRKLAGEDDGLEPEELL